MPSTLFAAVIASILLGALNAPRLRAQSAADRKLPEFEVASVKPSNSSMGRVGVNTSPGGRFSAVNTPLAMLVQFAYRLQPHQVVGGPDWFTSDRFDIVAKGEEGTSENQFTADQADQPSRSQLMLRALLADRFKLVVRAETREMPIYTLVMAKSDGRLGEALHRSSVDCEAPTAANGQPVTKKGATETGAPAPCGIRLGLGQMVAGGASMSQIASTLSGLFTQTVVDRTGLTGTFDATLAWTPDQSTPGMFMKAGFAPQAVDQNGPSIFTAVQEQLGLKLQAGKGPVNVLVIVSAQRPTAN